MRVITALVNAPWLSQSDVNYDLFVIISIVSHVRLFLKHSANLPMTVFLWFVIIDYVFSDGKLCEVLFLTCRLVCSEGALV